MHQGIRKKYKKQNSSKKFGGAFAIKSFMLDIDDGSTENDLGDFSADEEDA